MFSDDNSKQVLAHLDAIHTAAAAADADAVRTCLDALEQTDFNALFLDGARTLVAGEDFEGLAAWANARQDELAFDNPFADAFDDLDVDDMFSGFDEPSLREPSAVEADDELLDALGFSASGVDIVPASEFAVASEISEVSEATGDDSEVRDAVPRPHVLSGRFNVVRRSQEDVLGEDLAGSLFDRAGGLHDRSTAASIAAAPRPDDDDPDVEEEPTQERAAEAALEARSDVSEASEPIANDDVESARGFDFDFGSEFDDSDPLEDVPARDRQLTPLRQPAQNDEFGDLVDALAADSSPISNPQYRGEPIRVHSAETNPFTTDAPTGTGHLPLASESHAAESHLQTNMHAFVLEARRLRDVGELEAALDIARKVLSRDENAAASALRDEIEAVLEAQFVATLGALEDTPRLVLDMSALSNLSLDHRAGYIISQVDGMMTYLDLLELSGMSRLETLEVFCDLVEHGVIAT